MYIHSISTPRRSRNSIVMYTPCVAGTTPAIRGNLIFPEIWNSARAFSRLDAQLKSNAFVHKSGKHRRIARHGVDSGAFNATLGADISNIRSLLEVVQRDSDLVSLFRAEMDEVTLWYRKIFNFLLWRNINALKMFNVNTLKLAKKKMVFYKF